MRRKRKRRPARAPDGALIIRTALYRDRALQGFTDAVWLSGTDGTMLSGQTLLVEDEQTVLYTYQTQVRRAVVHDRRRDTAVA